MPAASAAMSGTGVAPAAPIEAATPVVPAMRGTTAVPAPTAAPVAPAAGARRHLLLHYHLFKNAGTSVDAVLKKNFGAHWANVEFPPPRKADHQALIRAFIHENPALRAISSHTLMLPAPEIEGIDIFPIVFVRHPLLRLRSAYEFERRQAAETAGAQLAKQFDFAGYIRARLEIRGDRSCRDFHVSRLAMAVPGARGSELERALAAVDALPFVGLVEAFDASMRLLEQRVGGRFPAFRAFDAWENATSGRERSIEERVGRIRAELREDGFETLMEANRGDLAVYATVVRMHGRAGPEQQFPHPDV
jgi:hypothetical protein